MLAGAGMKLARERGNQIVAGMADRFLQLGAAERATQAVSQKISGTFRGYLARATEVLPAMPVAAKLSGGLRGTRSLADGYQKTVDEVKQAELDPDGHAQKIGLNISTLSTHAPKVAIALGAKASEVTAYLAARVPPQPPGPSSLQPQIKGPPPSEMAMSSFMRVAAVLKDPLSLLTEMRRGQITAEQVDAVKANYPQLYQQFQKAGMEAVANRSTPIPYEKRKQLAVLFQIPTDPVLEPDFVATIQQSYAHTPDAGAQQAAEEKPRGHSAKGSLKSFATQTQTPFDRIG
jgi:hypothetical protein